MTYGMTVAGINMLKYFEGLKNQAYKDIVGNYTIGIGHKIIGLNDKNILQVYGAYNPDTLVLSDSECMDLANLDLTDITDQLVNSLVFTLNENQMDAILSFTFNLGVRAFESSSLKTAINNSATEDTIISDFLKWDNVTDSSGQLVPVRSLYRRRCAESLMYISPEIDFSKYDLDSEEESTILNVLTEYKVALAKEVGIGND